MKNEKTKLQIKKDSFDINLKFYFFLKSLNKANLSKSQINPLIENIILHKNAKLEERLQALLNFAEEKFKEGSKKQKNFILTIKEIDNPLDFELFVFSLRLYSVKNILLEEAKTKNLLDTSKLEDLSPLSLEYDKITTYTPYSTRVSGALLSLMFFEKLEKNDLSFASSSSMELVKQLSRQAKELETKGIEPNQIFMLMFNESVNQSITSESGSNYEDRIHSVLVSIGIKPEDIKKSHDKDDSSTEFDFFFELNGKSYGIGAKRTLRERYKQFIKTANMSELDVMIEITLGTDVRPRIADSIIKHGVFLFVSEEVYNQNPYLQKMKGIYSSKDFNLATLESLGQFKLP